VSLVGEGYVGMEKKIAFVSHFVAFSIVVVVVVHLYIYILSDYGSHSDL
jgi:hypothetical protein